MSKTLNSVAVNLGNLLKIGFVVYDKTIHIEPSLFIFRLSLLYERTNDCASR